MQVVSDGDVLALIRRCDASAAALTALAGLALLWLGGIALERPHPTLTALAALALGTFLWLVSIAIVPPSVGQAVEATAGKGAGGVRPASLALAVALAGGAWLTSSAGFYTRENVAFWLVAVVAWCHAWWPERAATKDRRQPLRERIAAAAPVALPLLAICAIGAFFRLHRLSDVPREPTSDHAEKLIDLDTIRSGERPIFFPRNTGREPGQFYITSWLIDVVGLDPSFDTLKLGTALVGIAVIPFVFLLARELAGPRAGLLAALLFSFSHWPVAVTRTGLRHGYGPLAAAAALWLLFRYLRTRDRRDAILCGLALGLGLHGYTAFRIVPPLVLVTLLAAACASLVRSDRRAAGATVTDSLVLAGAATFAALPLVRYAIDHPDEVWYRISTRATGTEVALGGIAERAETVVANLVNALLAFHWSGDSGLVTLERYEPFLDPFLGAGLVAGLTVTLVRASFSGDARSAIAIVSVLVLLLPSALSIAFPDENPSAVRLGVVAPLVFTLTAVGLDRMLDLAASAARLSRGWLVTPATAALLAVGLSAATAGDFRRYFETFDDQYRRWVPNSREVAAVVRSLTEQGTPLDDVYLVAFPHWVDGRNVGFELGHPEWTADHVIEPGEPIPLIRTRTRAFIISSHDAVRARELRALPGGVARLVASSAPGKGFVVYLANAR